MAEPIVRTFEIDTSKSEQNLRSLGTAFDSADNAGKSLKAQLRELQAQLADTDPQTQKYRDLSKAAGELKDKIQDAAQAVGTQAGGAFEKVSGSLGLVTSRLLSLDFTGAAEGAQLLASNIGSIKFDDIIEGVEGLGSSLLSVGRSILTNPLFLIGGAIAAAVVYWEELDQAIKDLNPELQRTASLAASLNEEIEKQSDSVGKQTAQINALFNAVQDQTKAEEERIAALEAIQTLYPDVFANQDVDINNTDALTNAKLTLVKAIEAEAKANAAKVLIEREYAQQFELQVKLAEAQAKAQTAQAKEAEILANSSRKTAAEIDQFTIKALQASNQTANAVANVASLQQELALNAKNIADIEKVVGDTIVTQAVNTAKAKKTENKKVVDNKKELNEEEKRDEEKLAAEILAIRTRNAAISAEITKKIRQDSAQPIESTKTEISDFDAEIKAQRDAEEFRISLMAEGVDKEIAMADAKYAAMRDAAKGNAEQLAIIAQMNADEVAAIEKNAQMQKLDFAKQTLNGIAQITSAFGKNNEKTAKAAFKVQKAISIAQATISTYESANAIFASTAKNPITTIFPSAPFVAAGVAVAAGLANVATIAAQQFQGSTSGGNPGGANPPSFGGGGGTESQPATFNPFASQFITNRPDQVLPRAYVLAGDVASQQEVRENVEDLSRIG